MADDLILRAGMLRNFAAAALIAAGLCALDAAAQALPDPTRPPAQVIHASGDADAGSGSSGGLQSVMISGKTRSAVINGEPVKLGGKVGEATVTRIDENGVTLRNADGATETLKLYPDVEIKPRKAASRARKHTSGLPVKKE